MSDPLWAVNTSGLSVQRGGHTVVRDMTLQIPGGTVFGLVGPSGSGKTSLIRGLLGLSPISGGTASVLGMRPGSAELRSRIGYMPQDAAIYPDLSCRENLEFFASIYRTGHSRIQELIDMLDLASIADRPVQSYSGGQKQRVALAAALIPNPDLVLLDEPTVGLDPRLRARLWDAFRAFAGSGATMVISTHVMDEAGKCDLVGFLSEGTQVATGTPAELMARAGTSDLESAVMWLTDPVSIQERGELRRVS